MFEHLDFAEYRKPGYIEIILKYTLLANRVPDILLK